MKCTCSKPGYCPRFDRKMVGRLYQICRDECDPPCPNRLAYTERWTYLAGRVTGFGDLINLVTWKTGIKRFVKRRAAKTGKPCGCEERRKKLNEAVPFQNSRS